MPQPQEFLSQMYFKIDGTQAPADMWHVVREVVVDTSLYLPDMFSIQLDDPNLTWIDSTMLQIGKTVEVSGKAEGESSIVLLTKGEIVAIEPELVQETGTTVSIRGYDKSHRLNRGKKTRVYQQMTDSDIVKKIAQECGLEIDIDATSEVHEHVFQDDRSDMEFVYDLARWAGHVAYVENGKLHFNKASTSGSPETTLEWGRNLTAFQARFSSAEQVAKAEVHGWDIKQKKAIIGTKESPRGTPTVDGQNLGGILAAGAFGSAQEVVNNHPVKTQGGADMLAQAIVDERRHNFFQAEGVCHGNPALRAGKLVQINGVGTRFSGRYMVTRAVHHYDISGYTTRFEISGFHSNTIWELLRNKKSVDPYGVVVGIVTNLKDPENLARVKVKFPTITDSLESNWARLVTPMAGANRGIEFVPEVNDEVLVAFEYNDINRPYIIGSLWNGQEKPPVSNNDLVSSDGKIQKRIIKSRSGHTITLDDTQSAEQIKIVDKSGQTIILDSSAGKEKIEIIDKTGKSKILMDAVKQSVSIESAMDLSIKAMGKIQIDGQAGVTINTTAGNLEMKSNAQSSLKGTATSIEGTASAELKSSGILTVQGSLVKIN
jgi:phage protein D/phage baseplate assembly protein gpV